MLLHLRQQSANSSPKVQRCTNSHFPRWYIPFEHSHPQRNSLCKIEIHSRRYRTECLIHPWQPDRLHRDLDERSHCRIAGLISWQDWIAVACRQRAEEPDTRDLHVPTGSAPEQRRIGGQTVDRLDRTLDGRWCAVEL